MQFKSVPAELRALPQWVCWRSIISPDGRATKPPVDPKAPNQLADVMNPDSWGTFEQAVSAYDDERNHLSGIGFVFTEQDDFFGIDIDDESKVTPGYLETRKQVVKDLLYKARNTYCEVSPSGNGLHIIGRGRMSGAGRRSTALQIEIYASGRYFTITGNVFDGRSSISDQQELLDLAGRGVGTTGGVEVGHLGDLGAPRYLDLSDQEVLQRVAARNEWFLARYDGREGCEPGEWSETFMSVVGALDQVTGKVEQLYRLVMQSGMVRLSPPSRAGESRDTKAQRNFQHVLGQVRVNNTRQLTAAEHGRQIYENMVRFKTEQAEQRAAEIMSRFEETDFSRESLDLLRSFPLEPKDLELSEPPGMAGEFVRATMGAVRLPFLKYAIPVTLATLAGIVARSRKLPNGAGPTLNFILAAPSSTGKTQTMEAWEHFLWKAATQNQPYAQAKLNTHSIKNSTSSIQGIFGDFAEQPSCVWYVDEAASQLQKMSDPKSPVDGQLRDAYNQLYDCARVGRKFYAPRSAAMKKENYEPIENLSVSTCWMLTPSKFDVFTDDAQDGFLSRVVIVRHKGAAGEARPPWELVPDLQGNAKMCLEALLAVADKFDQESGYAEVVSIDMTQVAGVIWPFTQICERIKNKALAGSLPPAYIAVARLPMQAERIAAVLAVTENPWQPVVTLEQWNWAFGYLLQNQVSILSAIDTGDLGVDMSRDIEVVVDAVKKHMRQTKDFGIKRNDLTRRLRQVLPFKIATPSPGEAVKRTISEMIQSGMLEQIQHRTGDVGRPVEMLTPTQDSVWK